MNEIIIDGVDVSECPHINAYNPNKPICQMYVGIGGSPSECRGNCAYIKEQNFKRLEQENETLNYQWHKQSEIGDEWYKVAEKYKTALEEIREMLPKSKCKYACFSCPESGQCKEQWAEPIKRTITETIGE